MSADADADADAAAAIRTVGLIGLGAMGAPMARALARAGFALRLHDRDAARTAQLASELGATAAASPAAASGDCDAVITMLPNAAIVRAVALGEGDGAQTAGTAIAAGTAIVDAPPRAGVMIDMSSSDPIATRALAAALGARGVTLLDAPVSGGVRGAAEARLTIMLGGDDEDAIARATPVLEAMGTAHRTGGVGSGHAAKALNNYVSAAGLAAACEAVIVAAEFGLDPGRLVGILNRSTGRNNSTENKLAPFILSGEFDRAGFALDLMAKDVATAAALADALGRPMAGMAAARDLWATARDHLRPGADHTEIYRFLGGARDA